MVQQPAAVREGATIVYTEFLGVSESVAEAYRKAVQRDDQFDVGVAANTMLSTAIFLTTIFPDVPPGADDTTEPSPDPGDAPTLK